MWLSYDDSEVKCFHPVCETAMALALDSLGLSGRYEVCHHARAGSLIMDYAVKNRATGNFLCVIEVKRSPQDVNSARYQYQAMSYVQMNATVSEKPFYILTNLEYALAFRYDAARPKVFQQMLRPGVQCIGRFAQDEKQAFTDKLAAYFKAQFAAFLQDEYAYMVTLRQFAEHMAHVQQDGRAWKTSLAVLLYEYIRGVFAFVRRSGLRDIRLFHEDIKRICREAARINFKEIFSYDAERFYSKAALDAELLDSLFDLGAEQASGDTVADVLHQIASAGHEHEGEVPTDLELGRAACVLARAVHGRPLGAEELVCDPAAGSGSLMSSAADVFGLQAEQIVVNDWNSKLLELLSLRIGLKFAKTVSALHSPAVYNYDVCVLEPEFFERVGIVLMNPPFVAGINCAARKQAFYRAIEKRTGAQADTDIGQMPLEAVFLEHILHLVPKGTTVACILPKTGLMARGAEAVRIRRLLLERLGLRMLFTYPGDKVFEEVKKDTCVVVGKVGEPAQSVRMISSHVQIPDLDLHRFAQVAAQDWPAEFCPAAPGLQAKTVPTDALRAQMQDGWHTLSAEMGEAEQFVSQHFASMDSLAQMKLSIKRGGAGNSGGSDLLFFDSRPALYAQFADADIVLHPAMRNAKHPHFCIGRGDSQFLDASANTRENLRAVIQAYTALPARGGRQQRKEKTIAQWEDILDKESGKGFGGCSVLIPRAIRRIGRVYLAQEKVFVSTNFVVCSLQSRKEAIVLSTWMASIFYQLICEISSKDQEGMRKMEVADIKKTLAPDFRGISADMAEALEAQTNSLEFLDLQQPEIRPVDRIWAAHLFGENAEEAAEEAARLLEFLAVRRNGGA